MSRFTRTTHYALRTVLLFTFFLTACQPVVPQAASSEPTTLVLASHDSFAASEGVIKAFEEANNVKIQVLTLGDAGAALNKIILSKGAPLADLMFGVDNTLLSRALQEDIFEPYDSPVLAAIPDEFKLDAENRLLPVDYGFVNINADKAWFADKNLPLPQTLEDLIKPEYKGLLVVENPATSSPGLAFLLSTIAHFGEEKYLDFWSALRANDVLVSDGWSDAYYTHFTVGSGNSGDRPLVISYASSPPADVVYASDGRTEPASVNINPAGGVWKQIEFVGVLKGAKHPELAHKLIDFMLDKQFQEDMPLQMYVYPVNREATLPEVFRKFAEAPSDTAVLDPAAIDAGREEWIKAWTEIMLR